jgi:Transposase IS116/IS110/IS902 family
MREHQDAVQRLAEVPGLGVDSAQQIIAEVGAKAATFASAKNLVSWVGACPGDEESAGAFPKPHPLRAHTQGKSVTYVSGTKCYLCVGPLIKIQCLPLFINPLHRTIILKVDDLWYS